MYLGIFLHSIIHMQKNAKKMPGIGTPKFICDTCSFGCSKKSNYTKHLNTYKHIHAINAIFIKNPKNNKLHKCKHCSKILQHQSSLSRHLKTCNKLYIVAPFSTKIAPFSTDVDSSKFDCLCGKSYKYKRSLVKHKKTCKILQDPSNYGETIDIVPTNNIEQLLKGILHENKILREKISNLEVGNITNNNTTINGNNYTINMFLNDKCKNAMNLEDFVEKIKFTLEDLQYTSDNGYANGISNVFIKNLKNLDVTERPIHCTDQKRLQFYVKNENVWKKDDVKLHASFELVSKKQSSSINNWVKENPNYMDSPQKCDEYFKLVNESTQSTDKNIKTIKKNVGNNVKLEKEDM